MTICETCAGQRWESGPPVGALRLVPPEPAPPWEGTRQADAFAESPPQSLALGLVAGPDNLADGTGDWRRGWGPRGRPSPRPATRVGPRTGRGNG